MARGAKRFMGERGHYDPNDLIIFVETDDFSNEPICCGILDEDCDLPPRVRHDRFSNVKYVNLMEFVGSAGIVLERIVFYRDYLYGWMDRYLVLPPNGRKVWVFDCYIAPLEGDRRDPFFKLPRDQWPKVYDYLP